MPAEVVAECQEKGWSAEAALKGIGLPVNDAMIESAESRLGVRLPRAYVELIRIQNGGNLVNDAVEFEGVDGWCESIRGIGDDGGLDAETGSLYMSREWEYPDGLIYLEGDGHTGFFLHYRECGPQGESSVLWLDTECHPYVEVKIADDFGAFLGLLV